VRVLVSTLNASPAAAHGGPVLAQRKARALEQAGIDVCIAAPGEAPGVTAVPTFTYPAFAPVSRRFAPWRPNEMALAGLTELLDELSPDVVCDVHGPAWAVEAAAARGIPAVALIGDYNWFCRRSFLVDTSLKRCDGPSDVRKCFECNLRETTPVHRLAHRVLREAARAGVAAWMPVVRDYRRYSLWEATGESLEYTARVRSMVSRFVVGDAKARAFLGEHGIGAERLAFLPQCLPDEALVRRPRAAGVPGTDRAPRFGFVGRLDPDKGLHVLARAFEALPGSSRAELWIASPEVTPARVAPFFASPEFLRESLASGRIRLVRPAGPSEVSQFMAEVDVGIVPSIAFESPSLAMLEFAAQGTPVVRSESDGMSHVIRDAVNGRTFPYGNAAALGAILAQILETPSVIAQWRAQLPSIGREADYARALVGLFEQEVLQARKSIAA